MVNLQRRMMDYWLSKEFLYGYNRASNTLCLLSTSKTHIITNIYIFLNEFLFLNLNCFLLISRNKC